MAQVKQTDALWKYRFKYPLRHWLENKWSMNSAMERIGEIIRSVKWHFPNCDRLNEGIVNLILNPWILIQILEVLILFCAEFWHFWSELVRLGEKINHHQTNGKWGIVLDSLEAHLPSTGNRWYLHTRFRSCMCASIVRCTNDWDLRSSSVVVSKSNRFCLANLIY